MDIKVLFTDTHFGVKNNSMTWLKSQLAFIYKQFIPELRELKKTHPSRRIILIHLGDVFDSRSTISTMVATEVRKAFGALREVVDEFNIIAGNHDYYSPTSDEVNSIDLLLSGLNINLFTKTKIYYNGDLYMPWYTYGDDIEVSEGVKRIFTHADIVSTPPKYKGIPIYSGHMHIPHIEGDVRNLGSCYALDFGDSNHHRGYYVLNGDDLEFVPNMMSIRFWRLYNDDILENLIWPMIKDGDYIELYISKENLSKQNYIEKINSLTATYKNLWVIPQINHTSNLEEVDISNWDMEKIAWSMVDDDLKEKFQEVLNRVNGSVIIE